MTILVYFSLLGAGEEFARRPILCPSRQHSIKLLRCQIQHELKAKQARLSIYFGGKELEDEYTIDDYEIGEEDVLQVSFKQTTTSINVANTEMTNGKETPPDDHSARHLDNSPPPSIECDQYYARGDYVDVYEDTTRSWFPACLVSIIPSQPTNVYYVNFIRSSLGSNVRRGFVHLRPQSTKPIAFDQMLPSTRVFVRVDTLWHVAIVDSFRLDKRSNTRRPWGNVCLNIIADCEHQPWRKEVVRYRLNDFFHLKAVTPRVQLEDAEIELLRGNTLVERPFELDCGRCDDSTKVNHCPSCGCRVCGLKNHSQPRLACLQCHQVFHVQCLPPEAAPTSHEQWCCVSCRNDAARDARAINRNHLEQRKRRRQSNKAECGHGMTCAGRTNATKSIKNLGCTFGSIEAVPVGTWWRFRVQASEAGVHAPLVAGVHGRESLGAYSLVFAGVYDGDVDLGDNLYYTAIGGRRTEPPAKRAKYRVRPRQKPLADQHLTSGVNRALAISCAAPFNEDDPDRGADANVRWREGTPIRVLRSGNARRAKAERSPYLPPIGVRYDGLYKVVKYWPETTTEGVRIWRFHLRRDDPAPAPWTEQGRYRARKLGLRLVYPPGWCKPVAGKRNWKVDERFMALNDANARDVNKSFSMADSFKIPRGLLRLIERDVDNKSAWEDLIAAKLSKASFKKQLNELFRCAYCQHLVCHDQPVTLPLCAHSFCLQCLQRSAELNQTTCPRCQLSPLDSDNKFEPNFSVNEALAQILRHLKTIFKDL